MPNVTFDAVYPGASGGNQLVSTLPNTVTWAHTCSGTERFLWVVASISMSVDTSKVVTATYNGVTMTQAGKQESGNGSAGFVIAFYLINPDVGTHNVVLSISGGGTPLNVLHGSVSFNGVDQATGIRNIGTAQTNGNPTINIASAVGNMVVDGVCCGSNIPVSTQTARWAKAVNNSNRAGNAGSSTAAGAASVTMAYTTSGDWWGIIAGDIIASLTARDNRRRSSLAWPLPIAVPPCPDGTVD